MLKGTFSLNYLQNIPMGIIKDTHYQLNSHNMKELMDKLEHTFAYLYQQRNPKDSYQCMMHFRHNNKVLMD